MMPGNFLHPNINSLSQGASLNMTAHTQKIFLKPNFLITCIIVLWLVSDSMPIATVYEEGLLPFGFMLMTASKGNDEPLDKKDR